MAIDPKLLVIKPVDELTEVTGLQDGDLLFYDGSGNLKRISIETFNNLSKTAKPLKPTDTTPTVAGLYMPTVIGTYTNAGGLIAEYGFDTLFYFNGTTWTKRALPYPQATKGIPQFADLSFPVTNTATEKVQCVNNFVPYQLLDGKTSAITDVPGVSAKWVKMSSNSSILPFQNIYNSASDVLDKFINNSGVEDSYVNIRHSGFIKVESEMRNVDLVLSNRPYGVGAAPGIFMYDSSKTYIGAINADAFANVFRITNDNCKYIRFNTVWIDGVANPNLSLYIAKDYEVAPYESNKGYENVNFATGIDITSVKALVNNINDLLYVDVISHSALIEIRCINLADNASEVIKINVGSAGYHRIPKQLITTSYTSIVNSRLKS